MNINITKDIHNMIKEIAKVTLAHYAHENSAHDFSTNVLSVVRKYHEILINDFVKAGMDRKEAETVVGYSEQQLYEELKHLKKHFDGVFQEKDVEIRLLEHFVKNLGLGLRHERADVKAKYELLKHLEKNVDKTDHETLRRMLEPYAPKNKQQAYYPTSQDGELNKKNRDQILNPLRKHKK